MGETRYGRNPPLPDIMFSLVILSDHRQTLSISVLFALFHASFLPIGIVRGITIETVLSFQFCGFSFLKMF